MWRYGLYALTNFQFHLIARIDDTTQVLVDNNCIHDNSCNALKTRLNWSKNVTEERDAPWQVMLGSIDTAFCVLTSLASWMELNHRENPNAALLPYLFSFSDDVSIPKGGQKSKETAKAMFNRVFKMDVFGGKAADGTDSLGSHSIRKFAATHAQRSGCTKDDKDIRGRWKSKAGVSDVYEDTELPYLDAKVADKLCFGGACYYVFPEEVTNTAAEEGESTTAMTKTFIVSKVVPNIRKRLPDLAALVLGKALLWLIYSPYNTTNHLVPQAFKDRIRWDLNAIVTATVRGVDCNAPDYNLIRQVPVVVTGDQGCVYMVFDKQQAAVGTVEHGGAGILGGSGAAGVSAQLLSLQAAASQIRRELQELQTNQMADRVLFTKHFTVVNGNLRRINLRPGVRGRRRTTPGNDDDIAAAALQAIAGRGAPPSLSPNLKNLFELWDKYQVGIGGRKAARLFSRAERGGKVKHKYGRRLVIWTMVCGLVRQ